MKNKFLLVLLCCIGTMLLASKCGSGVSAIDFSSDGTETHSVRRNHGSEPTGSKNPMELLDTASWEGYDKPKTIEFNKLKGARLQGLDFVLDKHLRNMYGYSIINPERTRYGLFEFDEVERMPLQPVDTVYAIIAAKGWLNGKWLPRVYIFWNKLDTIAKDTESNLRMRKETEGKRRTSKTIYSVGNLKDCLSTRLLGTDSMDALPSRYWAPIEDMEDDPNKFVSFAIKMIFKNGVITQAWVTMFYNGGVKLLR